MQYGEIHGVPSSNEVTQEGSLRSYTGLDRQSLNRLFGCVSTALSLDRTVEEVLKSVEVIAIGSRLPLDGPSAHSRDLAVDGTCTTDCLCPHRFNNATMLKKASALKIIILLYTMYPLHLDSPIKFSLRPTIGILLSSQKLVPVRPGGM